MVAPATVWLKPQEGLNPVGCTTQPTATAAAADARAAKGKERGNLAPNPARNSTLQKAIIKNTRKTANHLLGYRTEVLGKISRVKFGPKLRPNQRARL